MKKVSLVVAVAISAILVGCQDNNNLNPVGNEMSKAPSKVVATGPDGTIQLSGQVTMGPTETVDQSFNVEGQVSYTLVALDNQNFALSLIVDASLISFSEKGMSGKAYGESIDEVSVSLKEPVGFEKKFAVTGFDKDVDLYVHFSVTAESVVADYMWLEEALPQGSAKTTK